MAFKLLMLVFLFLTGSVFPLELDPDGKEVKKGYEKYKQQKYAESLQHFNRVKGNDPRIHFNRGAAHYKKGEYDKAIEEFSKTLESNNAELKAKSYYNIGNSFYKKGDKSKSAQSYMNAIKSDPAFAPARKNLDYLMQQQKQQKQNDKSQDSEQQQQEGDSKDEQNQDKKQKPQSQKDKPAGSDKKTGNKLDQKTLDRIMNSSDAEQINRRKMQSEYGKRAEKFW